MAVGNGVPYMGYQSAIGIAEETTFGTYVTSTAFLEFNTEGFKFTREEIKLETINTKRDFTRRLLGNDAVEGSIEMPLQIAGNGCLQIIKQAMGGTVGTAAASTGSYLHTLYAGDMESNDSTVSAADVKSLSFGVRRGNAVTGNNMWAFYGCRVNQLMLKAEIGQPVLLTAEIVGKGCSITTSLPAVSFSDVNPVNFVGVKIEIGDSITNAATEEFYTSFELTLNNNIDSDQRALGSREVSILPPVKREPSLKLTQRFDTITAFNRFIANTMTAIEITLDTLQTMGANLTTYAMIIRLPACYLNSVNPEVGGSGVITQELEYTVMYGSEAAYAIQMEVRNVTSGY